ncbi:10 kDa chaperonin [Phycisphaerae bacterium RAS1]|nr:10 kDa chaperonin [Phycisphaerae bacterium RAS1]
MATATMSRESTKKSMSIKVRPLDDRVVIQPAEAEERTRGGIVLPDSAREKPQLGKVIAAGPGKLIEKSGQRGEMSLKVGDTVFYGKYSGTEIEIDGETYVIIRESDVLAIQD